MPEIIPFHGYLYNQSKISLTDVVAPPYDVISPAQQEHLYEASPYNVVRLIFGREEDRYVSAGRFFEEWQREQILIRDDRPALYVLHQVFEDFEHRQTTRKGFLALCKLEEFEKRVVLPHEKTHAKPREDRFKLFKATNANFSQVFSLYSDPQQEVNWVLSEATKAAPIATVLFEDVQNELWRIQDQHALNIVQRFLHDKQVLIADGHHRYETALAYRDYRRLKTLHHTGRELYNYVMMFFTNIEDEGLVIFPTHRVVHSLERFETGEFLKKLEASFIIREFREMTALHEGMNSSSAYAFGLAMQQLPMFYLLTLKPSLTLQELIDDAIPDEVKKLDITVLHELILKNLLGISDAAQELKTNIEYVKDAQRAIEAVRGGSAQLVFLLNPTRIEQVRAVAKAGYTMPQKSTYFYPKLLSGLVINKLDE